RGRAEPDGHQQGDHAEIVARLPDEAARRQARDGREEGQQRGTKAPPTGTGYRRRRGGRGHETSGQSVRARSSPDVPDRWRSSGLASGATPSLTGASSKRGPSAA